MTLLTISWNRAFVLASSLVNKHIYCSFVINIFNPADLYGEAIVCSVEKESCSSNFPLRLLPGPQCVSKAMAGFSGPVRASTMYRGFLSQDQTERVPKKGGGVF